MEVHKIFLPHSSISSNLVINSFCMADMTFEYRSIMMLIWPWPSNPVPLVDAYRYSKTGSYAIARIGKATSPSRGTCPLLLLQSGPLYSEVLL